MTAPQQPYPQPTLNPPPHSTQRPPKRIGLLVIGVIIGLVIGGGGVALGWLLTGGTASATGPAAEAQAACLAVHGAQLPVRPQDWTLAEADRWVGAGALAQAAGKADGRYQSLSDALNEIGNAVQQFDTGSSQVRSAAAQAESICAATFH